MSDNNGNGTYMSPEQFGAYVQRVKNLEDKFDGLDRTLHALDTKIDRIAQPKWNIIGQVVTIGFVLFGGLGTYFYLPLRNTVDQNAEKVERTYLPGPVIEDKIGKQFGVLETKIDYLSARISKVEFNQENVRNSIISRSEHEQHWLMDRNDRVAIQRNVDKLENRLDVLQGLDRVNKNDK